MSERLTKATAVIWLDANVVKAVCRYVKRSVLTSTSRVEKLPGSRKEFSLKLFKHILLIYPKNRNRYNLLLEDINIPVIKLHSMKELTQVYQYLELSKKQII